MQKSKYRGLVSEEIIFKSEYPEIEAPVVRYSGSRYDKDLTFDWSCITKPFAMPGELKTNGFDQAMLFAGSNINDLADFQAEVELPLGKDGKKYTIKEPTLVYIPKGLAFGQPDFKKINQPVIYMNYYIAPKFSRDWVEGADIARYMVKPKIKDGTFDIRSWIYGNPFREKKTRQYMMIVKGLDIADGVNFSMFYYTMREPYLMTEAAHTHKGGMWIINLGGNPLNVEDFDAEIEYWWGEENQKVVIDSTSVSHVTPGLIHRSLNFARTTKPYYQIHAYTLPDCDKDELITGNGYNPHPDAQA